MRDRGRWLQRYDHWHDRLLEKSEPLNRRSAFSFPRRNHLQTEPIGYLSLAGHAVCQSLVFILTYSLIVFIGVVAFATHLAAHSVATQFPRASYRVQEKLVWLFLTYLVRKAHSHIIGFIWEQIIVGLILFSFAVLLDLGKLRAWNRRANRLRLNPVVFNPQPHASHGVWPPPPVGR